MKHFPLFILIIFSQQTLAQRVSHCTIFNEEEKKFTVYLNGEKKNETPQSNVRIVNLTQPYYNLKIKFEDKAIQTIERKKFLLTDASGNPVDAVHKLKQTKNGQYILRWLSQSGNPVYIQAAMPVDSLK